MPKLVRRSRSRTLVAAVVVFAAALALTPAAGGRQGPPPSPAAGVEQYTERLPSSSGPTGTEEDGNSTLVWVAGLLVLMAVGLTAAVAVQRRRAVRPEPEPERY